MRSRRRPLSAILVALILVASGACASRTAPPVAAPVAPPASSAAAAPRPVPLPDSVAWFRTSVEYRAVATEVYRLATMRLDQALSDTTWTAALEQTGDFGSKPPAVILDVDETVLDNSESEERAIRAGAVYSEALWAEWCNERKATPIPGALEFTRAAAAKGVTVFYVTNRDHALEQATRDNLGAFGFPLDVARDTVLTKGEQSDWTSEKSPRRTLIAQDYRILLLVGDDFGDFVAGARDTLAARKALSDAHSAMWGVKWIALPNPMYGSWKTAAGQ